MLGRAGRPSYHDMGKVYLIPEVGLKYDDVTEDMRAVELLESDVEPINVHYTEDAVVEQVLSDLCAGTAKDINCLLYTSDAADDEDTVDLGGCRIIKKKK